MSKLIYVCIEVAGDVSMFDIMDTIWHIPSILVLSATEDQRLVGLLPSHVDEGVYIPLPDEASWYRAAAICDDGAGIIASQ